MDCVEGKEIDTYSNMTSILLKIFFHILYFSGHLQYAVYEMTKIF